MSDSFAERMKRLEGIVEELERRGGDVADAGRDVLRAALDVHEAAITRALEIAAADGEAGARAARRLAEDPAVGSVLLLHGLHPVPLEARARAALARLGPELERRGAWASLDGAEGGVLRVTAGRTSGSAVGPLVEEALLAAAPDAEAIVVDEPLSALVPVARLTAQRTDDRRGGA